VYLGYHPGMSPGAPLLVLACVLTCACASKIPDVAPLCGTWADGTDMVERWWVDGDGLTPADA
jgi:hypothetical protein